MTKIKLRQIVQNAEALRGLIGTKLPIKIAYQLKRLAIEFDRVLKPYEDQRIELIKELGVKKEDSDQVSVLPENVTKFVEELSKLEDVEVELAFAEKIKIEDLGNIEIEASKLVDFIFE